MIGSHINIRFLNQVNNLFFIYFLNAQQVIWLIIVPQFLNIIGFGGQDIENFQKLFLFQIQFMENWRFLLVFIGVLIVIGGIAYSIICQKNYLRQIKIVKPFLKYLKQTA